MHSENNRTPRWKMLRMIFVTTVGLLIAQHQLHLTATGRKIVLVLIILAVYSSMGLWIRSNATALETLEAKEYRKRARNPAVYGTKEYPTPTQAHFRDAISLYRHAAPDKQERMK